MDENKLKQRLKQRKVPVGPTLLQTVGNPKVQNWLDIIIRKLIKTEHITRHIYLDKVSEYSDRRVLTTTAQNNLANNKLTSISKGRLTLDTFLQFVCMIMGYKVKSISMTFEREDGTTFTETVEAKDVD